MNDVKMFLIKLRILAPLASFNDMRRSGERDMLEMLESFMFDILGLCYIKKLFELGNFYSTFKVIL